VLIAALPAWYADHVPQVTIGVLAVIAGLILWLVQKMAIRLAFMGVFAALALFVYANRIPLEQCARTCECRLVEQDITVPICDPDAARK
jgi:hypothetical protein